MPPPTGVVVVVIAVTVVVTESGSVVVVVVLGRPVAVGGVPPVEGVVGGVSLVDLVVLSDVVEELEVGGGSMALTSPLKPGPFNELPVVNLIVMSGWPIEL